jgi:hypothetical protein
LGIFKPVRSEHEQEEFLVLQGPLKPSCQNPSGFGFGFVHNGLNGFEMSLIAGVNGIKDQPRPSQSRVPQEGLGDSPCAHVSIDLTPTVSLDLDSKHLTPLPPA